MFQFQKLFIRFSPKRKRNLVLDIPEAKAYNFKLGDRVIIRHSRREAIVSDLDFKTGAVWLDDEWWSYNDNDLIKKSIPKSFWDKMR